MSLTQLLEEAAKWLAWMGLGLGLVTIIAFFVGWGAKFRLVGATVFSLLLSISSWAFLQSYTPPLVVNGAKYAPVVYDNGNDLVVAKAPEGITKEGIQPTLEQIAGNLKGGGRNRTMVHVRLRELSPDGEGISKPIVLGEVIRDIEKNITIPLKKDS